MGDAVLVALLGISGFLLRLQLVPAVPVIEPDGAFYARLAQDILLHSGDGFHPAWPPLLPRMVALLTRVLHPGLPATLTGLADPLLVERSARLVGCALGALLVWPVAVMARRTVGRVAGLVAAALVAVHPWLVRFSVQALTEMPFTFFAVTSLALVGSAIQRRGAAACLAATAAGLAGGLAYLTRPEGIILPVLGLAALATARTPRPRRAVLFALLAAACLLATAPHVARLSAAAGRLSIGGKVDYNLAVAYSTTGDAPHFDRSRSEYNNLPGAGLSSAASPEPIPAFPLARLLTKDPGRFLGHALGNLPAAVSAPLSLTYLPFAALALVGLAGRRRRLTAEEALWAATWAAFVLLYAPLFVYRRFFAAIVPLLLIESAGGLTALGALEHQSGHPAAAGVPARLRAAAAILLFLILTVPAPLMARRSLSVEGAPREQRALGLRLGAELGASGLDRIDSRPGLMARKPVAAYYGGTPILAMAAAPPESLAAEARRRGAGFVLVDERDLARERPDFRFLLDPSAAPPDLQLVGSHGAPPETAVLYRVSAGRPPEVTPLPAHTR